MPQPKSSPPRKRSRSSAARQDDNALRAVRDLLARGVMLPTERLREAVEDAVRRGRMTRDDAEELLQSLLALGRRQSEDVLADLEQLLGRSRGAASSGARKGTDRVIREVDRARRVAGLGSSFPISGYDDLTAAQISGRLSDLTPAELRKVRDYERRHGNRKTVLAAVERQLG